MSAISKAHSVSQLNGNVLQHAFTFLPLEDLITTTRAVCKEWRTQTSNEFSQPRVWGKFAQRVNLQIPEQEKGEPSEKYAKRLKSLLAARGLVFSDNQLSARLATIFAGFVFKDPNRFVLTIKYPEDGASFSFRATIDCSDGKRKANWVKQADHTLVKISRCTPIAADQEWAGREHLFVGTTTSRSLLPGRSKSTQTHVRVFVSNMSLEDVNPLVPMALDCLKAELAKRFSNNLTITHVVDHVARQQV